MISKELLSLVLGMQVKDVDVTYDHPNHVVFNHKNYKGKQRYTNAKNLECLGRLCKEWVDKNTPTFIRSHRDITGYANVPLDFEVKYFRADTELEAIIKATEWVAKEWKLY